jgi:hypothetical protein
VTCPCDIAAIGGRCDGFKAEIWQRGRWSWTLKITHGPSVIGDPMYGLPRAWGSRERAEQKARKIIAKQLAWYDREKHIMTAQFDGEIDV